jgi:alpha-1,3/alpha-1,6-mannosyltransferase
VPLEAMLAGVPVLAADVGGPTETVVEGVTGWLRGDDVDEWVAVMRDILTERVGRDERQRMGQQGRRRVKKLFSKDTMASRLDEEVQKMDTAARPPILSPLTPVLLAVLIVVLALVFPIWNRRRGRSTVG